MNPIRNPYNPGAGTPPPALTGRDELIEAFAVTLQRAKLGRAGKSLMPIGLRGVGKTVLLNRFIEEAEHYGFKIAQLEATDAGQLAAQLLGLLRKVLLEFDRLGALSEKVRAALRVLTSFSLTIPDGARVSLNFDPERGKADSGRLSDDLIDVFIAVGEAAADRGSGVLLAIDEVQSLGQDELAALIVAIHRTTQMQLPIVLVAAGLPQLPGLAGEAKSYAERLFDFPEIGSLSPEAAAEAIAVPAANEGVEFTDEALQEMLRVTDCYPYFIQEWAYIVWNHAPGSPVTLEDVRAVADLVDDRLDKNFFRVRFDRLTPSERKYLRAMAELGPGPHRSAEIAELYGAKIQSVAPLRSTLIHKGMIYSPGHGDTAFTVPLFDQFMKRAMP